MKRIVSMVLSFTLVVSCLLLPVSAKEQAEISAGTQQCGCGYSPEIYVAALGSAKIYAYEGTENEKLLFRPETEQVVGMVKSLLPSIIRLAITHNYSKFGDKLIPALYDFMGDLAMDDNGDSLPYVTAKGATLPTDSAHGSGKSYYFGYDFRTDPLVTAQKLNEYIEGVKVLTGHDKVNLRASSMGGVITMSYLRLFGSESVDSLIFQCCPILGTQVAGELLAGEVAIDKDALVDYASQALPELENPTAEKALGILIKVLDKTGAMKALVQLANKIMDKLFDRVYEEFLIPVLGKMPGIWSFVPDNCYQKAKDTALDKVKNAKLIERLDNYHYNVQCSAKKILEDAKNGGVRIMLVAGCGLQRTPLVKSYRNDSDATVDTMFASAGATVALRGSTLGSGYVQKVDDGHNHLSADGTIDASTCILPENTWFIKGMIHSSTHSGHSKFYKWFFTSDEDFTVHSNPDYPQFMQNDVVNECFTALRKP